MKSIISGVCYGLLTFIICSAIYALISSLYYYFINPVIVREPNITASISFIIIAISTFIAVIKAKKYFLMTGLCFFSLLIILQLSLLKGTLFPYVMTEYMQMIWRLIAVLIGTLIGAIIHTIRYKNA